MNPKVIFGVVSILAALVIMMPQAQAQCTLGSLVGPWTFATDGFQFPPTEFLASGGQFVAAIGADRAGNPIGVMQVIQTSSVDGSPTRLESDAGRYQVNGDCSGGTLTLNVSSRPIQFDFFFVNADEIFVIGSEHGDIVQGYARRFTAPACPANALDAVTGTWVFRSHGFTFPPTTFLASAGRFVASIGIDRAGQPFGSLVITQTASIDGSGVRQEIDAGKFQVNGNCSGGTLTFNVSSRPVQFDFYFISANEMVIIGSNNADIVLGVARRFGT